MDSGFKAQDEKFDAKIYGLDEKFNAKIDGLDKKLDAKIDGIDKKLTLGFSLIMAVLAALVALHFLGR
jgi:hypothetical protein